MINHESETEVQKLKELEDFLLGLKSARNSWGALIRGEDGSLQLFKAASRPCYGEIRRYEDGTRPQDPHPGDLPRPIPFGVREAFGVRLYKYSEDVKFHNEIVECMFGPESPWRRGLGKEITIVDDRDGRHTVVLLTDTEFDPTVLSNLLIFQRNAGMGFTSNWMTIAACRSKLPMKQALFLSCFTNATGGQNFGANYYMQAKSSYRRFMEGDTVDLSNNKTWRDQEDYNRPQVSEIFYEADAQPIPTLLVEKGQPVTLDTTVQNFLKNVVNEGDQNATAV